uniref:Uncharacterized protein n=1 Tax=Sus scrofa TaxID=9823 RepID=A0A8D1V3F7_PIG
MEDPKIYDSFQRELQDYIRKQRARGLQPEVCFRKVTKDSEYREEDPTAPRPPQLGQRFPFRKPHTFPSYFKKPRAVESHLPPLSNSHHFRKRLGPINHHQKEHDQFFNSWWLPSPPVQGTTSGPRGAQHREATNCLSEDRTSIHPAGDQDRSWKRRFREKGGGGHGKKQQVEWKRRHCEEGEDSHKENGKKAKAEPGSTEKSKHRKKSTHAWDTTKEGRWSSREKKHHGQESTQEWDLWDEAILGSCY